MALSFKNGRDVSNLIEVLSEFKPAGLEMSLCAAVARSLCTVVASRNSLPSLDAIQIVSMDREG